MAWAGQLCYFFYFLSYVGVKIKQNCMDAVPAAAHPCTRNHVLDRRIHPGQIYLVWNPKQPTTWFGQMFFPREQFYIQTNLLVQKKKLLSSVTRKKNRKQNFSVVTLPTTLPTIFIFPFSLLLWVMAVAPSGKVLSCIFNYGHAFVASRGQSYSSRTLWGRSGGYIILFQLCLLQNMPDCSPATI